MTLFALTIIGKMSAGDAFVAGGTFLLAVFTAWLAFGTRSAVALNKQAVALTGESVEALDRPFVIASNDRDGRFAFVEGDASTDGPRFAYRLWNLGKGPAIVENVSLRNAAGTEFLTVIDALERPVAAAPAMDIRDELTPFASGVPGVGAELTMRIFYRSASGRRYTTELELQVVQDLLCVARNYRRAEAPAVKDGAS